VLSRVIGLGRYARAYDYYTSPLSSSQKDEAELLLFHTSSLSLYMLVARLPAFGG
jgi:hypothetical protein